METKATAMAASSLHLQGSGGRPSLVCLKRASPRASPTERPKRDNRANGCGGIVFSIHLLALYVHNFFDFSNDLYQITLIAHYFVYVLVTLGYFVDYVLVLAANDAF